MFWFLLRVVLGLRDLDLVFAGLSEARRCIFVSMGDDIEHATRMYLGDLRCAYLFFWRGAEEVSSCCIHDFEVSRSY